MSDTVTQPSSSGLQEGTQDLETLAKGYGYVNWALLLFMIFVGYCFLGPSVSPESLFVIGPLLVILNFAFIFVTAHLGRKVMGAGWIFSLFVSFFGHFIAAMIFSRIAADRLKKNGYKVGLMKAIRDSQSTP